MCKRDHINVIWAKLSTFITVFTVTGALFLNLYYEKWCEHVMIANDSSSLVIIVVFIFGCWHFVCLYAQSQVLTHIECFFSDDIITSYRIFYVIGWYDYDTVLLIHLMHIYMYVDYMCLSLGENAPGCDEIRELYRIWLPPGLTTFNVSLYDEMNGQVKKGSNTVLHLGRFGA